MRKSLKRELFFSISLLIICVLILIYGFLKFYMDDFYEEGKRNQMKSASKEILEAYDTGDKEFQEKIYQVEIESDLKVLIMSENEELIYATQNSRGRGMMMGAIYPSQETIKSVIEGKSIFEKKKHSMGQVFLIYTQQIGDGIISLSSSTSTIGENVDIAGKFFVYVGLFSILIGTIFSYVYSTKFTKPILEIGKFAENIGDLKFDEKYVSKRQDEIGVLSNNINKMAENLKKAYVDLEKANEKLKEDIEKERELEAMRKQFISDVSHELKTPISLIGGYCEAILDEIVEGEERKKYLEIIFDETIRMERMVKELLELSKLENSVTKLNLKNINLSEVLNNLLDNYFVVFEKKDMDVKFDIEKNIFIKADEKKIKSAMENYITNAVDYTSGEIKINLKKSNGEVVFGVYNSGNLIDEKHRKRIWESFYKIDESRNRSFGGSGLGLSIVRRIVDMHGGECDFKNETEGVLFWIKLKM